MESVRLDIVVCSRLDGDLNNSNGMPNHRMMSMSYFIKF